MNTLSVETTADTFATESSGLIQAANATQWRTARERLIDLYESEYRILQADVPERRRAAHGLRYQVYCVENQFEDAATHPDGMEADEFDGHAVQYLLERRSDGAAIGTVRLILPVRDRLADCLPFSRLCRRVVPRLDLLLPLDRMAEVSRFCISKELRRRPDSRTSQSRAAALSRYATLGLIRGLVTASLEHDIRHWCLVVEPALLRFLGSLGLQFDTLGPVIEYHGRRQPCHADLATLLEGVRQRRPEVWEVITDDGRLVPPARRPRRHPEGGALRLLPPAVISQRRELAII